MGPAVLAAVAALVSVVAHGVVASPVDLRVPMAKMGVPRFFENIFVRENANYKDGYIAILISSEPIRSKPNGFLYLGIDIAPWSQREASGNNIVDFWSREASSIIFNDYKPYNTAEFVGWRSPNIPDVHNTGWRKPWAEWQKAAQFDRNISPQLLPRRNPGVFNGLFQSIMLVSAGLPESIGEPRDKEGCDSGNGAGCVVQEPPYSYEPERRDVVTGATFFACILAIVAYGCFWRNPPK